MSLLYINNATKRKKQKRKPGWREAEAQYEEWLRSHGVDTKTSHKKEKVQVHTLPTEPKQFIRETAHYKSLSTGSGQTSKTKIPEYTGDYFVGIATMHKSNLVPVGRDTDAKDYATMRRN